VHRLVYFAGICMMLAGMYRMADNAGGGIEF
jgi:hypothetical protein